jgi:hypothetical protein
VTPDPSPSVDIGPALARADVLRQCLDQITACAHLSLHVSALRHPAPHLALALVALAVCGVAVAGAWLCRHGFDHFGKRLRGLVSPRVWLERRRWSQMVPVVYPASMKRITGASPVVMKPIGGWTTRSGTTLLIRFKNRANVFMMEKEKLEEIRSEMRCPVQIEPVYLKPHRCLVRLQRRDTLRDPVAWPWLHLERTNFFSPIPMAVDLDGATVHVDLRGKHVLIGGTTGAGKSVTVQMYIAAAALDPRVRIHVIAGKMGTDFRVWEPICDTFITDDEDDEKKLIPALERITALMNRSFKAYGSGQKKVNWDTVKHVDLVVTDEPRAFPPVLGGYQLKWNGRGRSAGLMNIYATQRPSSKAMDTDQRALFPVRHAHRLDDAGMLMSLGDSYRGFTAADFGPDRPGEEWLIPNDGKPVRCRSFLLTDADLASISARAQRLRGVIPAGPIKVDCERDDEVQPDSPPSGRFPISGLLAVAGVRPPSGRRMWAMLEAVVEHEPATAETLRQVCECSEPARSSLCGELVRRGLVSVAPRAPQEGRRATGAASGKVWSPTEAGRGILSLQKGSQAEREEVDA